LRGAVNPLEKGWTGGKPGGRRFGPPEAFNEEMKFENFESILLHYKTLFRMTGNLGRVRRHSILMITGNRNGTVGFSLSAGKYGKGYRNFRKAVNKAGLRLVNIERFEDRTVFHDFFTQFGHTRIVVRQQPPGSGITAHRAIKAICELAGIKDLYAKCEGNVKNYTNVTKAFILGLLRQKTHQTLADEKQLHLVELRPENDYYPRVLASPSNGKVRTEEEIGHNEILDFEMISFEGRLPVRQAREGNTYKGTAGWNKYLRKGWVRQSQPTVRKRMRVEHGDEWGSVRSHLHEKYPECVDRNWKEVVAECKARKMGEQED
jgi:small subunit ribosomal protein S5